LHILAQGVARTLFMCLPVLVFQLFRRGFRDGCGQDLVEYGLLAGFVSLAVYGGAVALGEPLEAWYAALRGEVATMSNEAPGGSGAPAQGVSGSSGGTGSAQTGEQGDGRTTFKGN
jgi:Flp pilus assembly pilin Flp